MFGAMEFTYDLERQLIAMVEERKCLWYAKDENYHRKQMKENAFREIAESLDPKCTVAAVKNRWANLRSQFQRELRKIRESLQSANDPAELYVPKWGHFQHLQFLRPASDEVLADFASAMERRSISSAPENGKVVTDESKESNTSQGASPLCSSSSYSGGGKRKSTLEVVDRPQKLPRDNTQAPPDQCHGFGIMMEHSVREIPEGPNRDLAMLLAHQALVKFKLFLNDEGSEVMEQTLDEFFRK